MKYSPWHSHAFLLGLVILLFGIFPRPASAQNAYTYDASAAQATIDVSNTPNFVITNPFGSVDVYEVEGSGLVLSSSYQGDRPLKIGVEVHGGRARIDFSPTPGVDGGYIEFKNGVVVGSNLRPAEIDAILNDKAEVSVDEHALEGAKAGGNGNIKIWFNKDLTTREPELRNAVKLRVGIPKNLMKVIAVSTGDGSIALEGFSDPSKRLISLKSGSGAITCKDACALADNLVGSLQVTSHDGGIKISGAQTANMSVSTHTGSVAITDTSASQEARIFMHDSGTVTLTRLIGGAALYLSGGEAFLEGMAPENVHFSRLDPSVKVHWGALPSCADLGKRGG